MSDRHDSATVVRRKQGFNVGRNIDQGDGIARCDYGPGERKRETTGEVGLDSAFAQEVERVVVAAADGFVLFIESNRIRAQQRPQAAAMLV